MPRNVLLALVPALNCFRLPHASVPIYSRLQITSVSSVSFFLDQAASGVLVLGPEIKPPPGSLEALDRRGSLGYFFKGRRRDGVAFAVNGEGGVRHVVFVFHFRVLVGCLLLCCPLSLSTLLIYTVFVYFKANPTKKTQKSDFF